MSWIKGWFWGQRRLDKWIDLHHLQAQLPLKIRPARRIGLTLMLWLSALPAGAFWGHTELASTIIASVIGLLGLVYLCLPAPRLIFDVQAMEVHLRRHCLRIPYTSLGNSMTLTTINNQEISLSIALRDAGYRQLERFYVDRQGRKLPVARGAQASMRFCRINDDQLKLSGQYRLSLGDIRRLLTALIDPPLVEKASTKASLWQAEHGDWLSCRTECVQFPSACCACNKHTDDLAELHATSRWLYPLTILGYTQRGTLEVPFCDTCATRFHKRERWTQLGGALLGSLLGSGAGAALMHFTSLDHKRGIVAWVLLTLIATFIGWIARIGLNYPIRARTNVNGKHVYIHATNREWRKLIKQIHG